MVRFIEFSENKPCFNQVFSGVQLLPYSHDKYVIPFEYSGIGYNYFIVDCFGNRTNINSSITRNIKVIELRNIQYDTDRRVYIEASEAINIVGVQPKKYYSNVFKISSYEKEYTTRIDYKCKGTDALFSTQVQIFEDHDLRQIELKNYNQIASRRSVSYVSFNAKYSIFRSKMMYIETLNKIQDLFSNRFVYFNFEQVNLFASPDVSSPDLHTYMLEGNFEITKLGKSINPIYALSTESPSTGCFIEFTQAVEGLFTKDKGYVVWNQNGVDGIDDNNGNFHAQTDVLQQYPNITRPYCFAYPISALTTENNKLIQIENGR